MKISSARKVRRMIRLDMPRVLDIESRSFDYPWDEKLFIGSLRQRNCIGLVCEDLSSEKVVGYAVYELLKTETHLLNLAVDFDHRRKGIGSSLIVNIKNKLWLSHERTSITLEVAESNVGAQCFFRSQIFKAVDVLKDFYIQNEQDAYMMQFKQNEPV